MRRFWDQRAQENALYFIDSELNYDAPDRERFFRNGEEALDVFLGLFDIEVRPTDEIVEIGCGAGRQTRALAARAGHVTATDVSERMLDLARELNGDLENVDWMLGDGESLAGVDDATAEGCLSYFVFPHIPDPAITLGYVRETGRVLRPGGWAVYQISTNADVHRRPGLLKRFGVRVNELLHRGPKGQTHRAWLGSAVDLDELRQVADGAGMDVEGVKDEGALFSFVLLRRRG